MVKYVWHPSYGWIPAPQKPKRKKGRKSLMDKYKARVAYEDVDIGAAARSTYKGAKLAYGFFRPPQERRLEKAKKALAREKMKIVTANVERDIKRLRDQHKVKSIYAKKSVLSKLLRR